MRDDADAASSVGVNIFAPDCSALLSVGFHRTAGAIFYLNRGSIFLPAASEPNGPLPLSSLLSSRIGTIEGPILGAIIYVALSEYLSKYPGYSMIILGFIAIVVIVALPYGIAGTIERKLNLTVFSTRRTLEG